MNSRSTRIFVACLLLLGLLLSACQPADLESASADSSGYEALRISAPNCDYGGLLRSIEAVDRYTVRFSLCRSDPAFLSKLAFPVFTVQDQTSLDSANGNSTLMDAAPNGSGPYLVSEWVKGDHITLKANPNYWGKPPLTQTITLRWDATSLNRLVELQYENVDGIDRPAQNHLISIHQQENMAAYSRPSLNTFFIGFNNNFGLFSNENVRQAFAMAIDRQALLDATFQPNTEIAEQFLPSTMTPGFSPGYRWYDFNQKEAKDLLTEAGFDFREQIVLAYSSQATDYLPNPSLVAEGIRSQLAELGVHIITSPQDPGEFAANVVAGKYPMYLYGWTAELPDATDFYDEYFSQESTYFGKPYADIHFNVSQASKEPDLKMRQDRYNRINELIRLHVPAIPVAHSITSLVFNHRVQNVMIGPMNENFEEMTTPDDQLSFMQASEPVHIWPADETSADTLRVSRLVYDTLLTYEFGTANAKASLAETWESNIDQTEWTFTLRYGVKFSNGAELDANDVVASFAAMWDAKNSNHNGSTGQFAYFKEFFGGFINEN